MDQPACGARIGRDSAASYTQAARPTTIGYEGGMPQEKPLDIALYGATGFTGGLVAEYLAGVAGTTGLRWALAGRNRQKLEAVKGKLQGYGAGEVEIVIADSADSQSLRELAGRTRVVVTTVGPYARHGEPLVKACAEGGTDYVDLTGEPAFVDAMIERYDEVARKTGAKIVHACGFDSIPHDLGAYFTLKALHRRLSAAERDSVAVKIEGFVRASGSFSGGTWHSAIAAMGNARHDAAERKRRSGLRKLADGRKVRVVQPSVRYRKELGYWALPMPTIDPQIVLRSARTLVEYGPEFQYGHYMGLRHAYQVAGLAVGVGAVFSLAQTKPTRELLLKLRNPGDGPERAAIAKGWFTVTFQGQAGRHRVTCDVRGGDPGYGDTAKMLSEAALSLAFDRASLPATSGVLTTVVAFGDALIPRLEAAGIRFREV